MNNEQNFMEPDLNQIVVPTTEGKKTQKKGKVLLIIILLVIAIAIGLYFGYQKLALSPINIYKNAINGTYDLVDGFLEENLNKAFKLDPLQEAFTLNANLKLGGTGSTMEALNGYRLAMSLGMDYPEELINLEMNLSENNRDIINILLAILNNKAYLESADIYDQVLDLGEAYFDADIFTIDNNTVQMDYEDLHVILTKTKEFLIGSLNEEKFRVIDKATIEVNKKNVDCKQITYILDQSNLEATYNYMASKMANDTEFITALANMTGKTESDIKEALQEEVNISDIPYMEINLYVNSTNKIIAGNLIADKESVIRFTYQDDLFRMIIGDEYTNLEMNYEADIFTMKYNEYEEEILSIVYTNKENKQIDITSHSYGETYNLVLDMNNIKENQNEISMDLKIEYTIDSYGTKNTLELDGNITIEKDFENKLDTTNTIDIKSLTEEEQNVIIKNLMTILEHFDINADLSI